MTIKTDLAFYREHLETETNNDKLNEYRKSVIDMWLADLIKISEIVEIPIKWVYSSSAPRKNICMGCGKYYEIGEPCMFVYGKKGYQYHIACTPEEVKRSCKTKSWLEINATKQIDNEEERF